ncbi:MAG: TRAP transporter large permease subunit [Clostridium fessum]
MMDFAEVLTGHMKGGLAQVNVVLSMLMGGCSGSANADCAMQSKMLVPEMEKRVYSKAFSAAITAASSACHSGYSAGGQPDRVYTDCQISLGRTLCSRIYSGYS